jgi:hypothetical protein
LIEDRKVGGSANRPLLYPDTWHKRRASRCDKYPSEGLCEMPLTVNPPPIEISPSMTFEVALPVISRLINSWVQWPYCPITEIEYVQDIPYDIL